MAKTDGGAFPDSPYVPTLPHLRPANFTPDEILAQVVSIVRSARDAIKEIEGQSDPDRTLARIREAVTDIRRVTFVLQTLRHRVAGFDDWYSPIQVILRSDPLMRYFVELRNEIEKRGLPGAIAELYYVDTDETIGDVACYEDSFGLAVSGAVRPGSSVTPGELARPCGIRNLRLPDPPELHSGVKLTDLRIAPLATLAIDYLEELAVLPAIDRFGKGKS